MEEKCKKQALRMFSYGVYVLTSENDGDYCVSTITWVSQASFEPPMISVCIKRNSASYEIVKKRGEFILHLLGENQKKVSKTIWVSIPKTNPLPTDFNEGLFFNSDQIAKRRYIKIRVKKLCEKVR